MTDLLTQLERDEELAHKAVGRACVTGEKCPAFIAFFNPVYVLKLIAVAKGASRYLRGETKGCQIELEDALLALIEPPALTSSSEKAP